MSEGKKRVVCKTCHHGMCYLCGNEWRDPDSRKKHVCGMKGKIHDLEK